MSLISKLEQFFNIYFNERNRTLALVKKDKKVPLAIHNYNNKMITSFVCLENNPINKKMYTDYLILKHIFNKNIFAIYDGAHISNALRADLLKLDGLSQEAKDIIIKNIDLVINNNYDMAVPNSVAVYIYKLFGDALLYLYQNGITEDDVTELNNLFKKIDNTQYASAENNMLYQQRIDYAILNKDGKFIKNIINFSENIIATYSQSLTKEENVSEKTGLLQETIIKQRNKQVNCSI